MVWIGRNLRDGLAPASLPWAEILFTKLDAQSPIQPVLVHFYGWDIQNFSCLFLVILILGVFLLISLRSMGVNSRLSELLDMQHSNQQALSARAVFLAPPSLAVSLTGELWLCLGYFGCPSAPARTSALLPSFGALRYKMHQKGLPLLNSWLPRRKLFARTKIEAQIRHPTTALLPSFLSWHTPCASLIFHPQLLQLSRWGKGDTTAALQVNLIPSWVPLVSIFPWKMAVSRISPSISALLMDTLGSEGSKWQHPQVLWRNFVEQRASGGYQRESGWWAFPNQGI